MELKYRELKAEIEAAIHERFKQSPKRLAHVLSVAKTAKSFAKHYIDDKELAQKSYLTGLLHDWNKFISLDEQKELIVNYKLAPLGIEEEELLKYPQILHAYTGAHSVKERWPQLSEDIISAIRVHSIPSKTMSDLDKIIFCADLLEPKRGVKELDEIRASFQSSDLDELYRACLAQTLVHLIKHNRPVLIYAVEAWNELARAMEKK